MIIRSGFGKEGQLEIFAGDALSWSGIVPARDTELEIPLGIGREWTPLRLETRDGADRPFDVTGAADVRRLAFAITSVRIGRVDLEPGQVLSFARSSKYTSFLKEGWAPAWPDRTSTRATPAEVSFTLEADAGATYDPVLNR